MPAYCPFSVDPLSNPIGALIRGLDLTETVNSDALLDIRSAWSRHLVLVFEGQGLTPAQQLNFARQLAASDSIPDGAGFAGLFRDCPGR